MRSASAASTAAVPHVYLELGLAVPHVGARGPALLAETLELAPFDKRLDSSVAYGLPELLPAGRRLPRDARRGLRALGITGVDGERVAVMIGAGNARRVYGLR